MTVLISNATLGVRRRTDTTLDAHGFDIPTTWASVQGPLPGLANEGPDGSWILGLDPTLWPVRQADLVIGSDGRGWLVQTADLLQNALDPTVDWVRCTALQRSPGGTEPGGSWFVARFAPDVGPIPSGPAELYTGEGPPPDDGELVLHPGDEYLDILTGTIYEFLP